jgi:hypothetical protein
LLRMKLTLLLTNGFAGLSMIAAALAKPATPKHPLAGAWTLVVADVQHPDGSRGRDYGEHPKGLMIVDDAGHYAAQIYDGARPKFAAGEKSKGTPEEFHAAVMGSSAHFGTLEVDGAKKQLIYRIEGSAYPNLEGFVQTRQFELDGDELSYKVPPRPNGDVPITIWRRLSGP